MIHELSDVKCFIDESTDVWQYVVILSGAKIGKHCNINCHVFIENDVVIGDFSTIKSGVYLWDGVSIGNHVFIAPNVTFINDKYPASKQYPKEFQKTIIKDHASIGAGSIILGGVTIGEGAMIGAGSLVTKDVPDYELWYGGPAKKSLKCLRPTNAD